VKQFVAKCPPKGKADFLASILEICSMTSSIVFVNTKRFAQILLKILQKKDLKPVMIIGGMENDERDEMMAKFRN
jgi:superfamily II DNA/RNA helicase